jgi:hypothetical protein
VAAAILASPIRRVVSHWLQSAESWHSSIGEQRQLLEARSRLLQLIRLN